MPGVVGVMVAADYAPLISEIPQTRLDNLPEHRSPPQLPLVEKHIRHQGEPLVVVAAETILQAEDAAASIHLEYDELPVISSVRSMNLDSDNIASEIEIGPGVPKNSTAMH